MTRSSPFVIRQILQLQSRTVFTNVAEPDLDPSGVNFAGSSEPRAGAAFLKLQYSGERKTVMNLWTLTASSRSRHCMQEEAESYRCKNTNKSYV